MLKKKFLNLNIKKFIIILINIIQGKIQDF